MVHQQLMYSEQIFVLVLHTLNNPLYPEPVLTTHTNL
jgi:hypothetical protein